MLQHSGLSPTGGTDLLGPRPGLNQYLLAMGPELRTPLNAVIGMSGLLLDGDLSAKQRHYVKGIHAAGESLAATLNDVLDLARTLDGRLPVDPIPFDLKSMVEETAKVLATRAEERGLVLRVDWRPELPRYVIGDPGRIRQVLANLIGHAVNATSQGEVVVRLAQDGEWAGLPLIRFTVEDTGIGLPPERIAAIFDQYVPVDASPYRSFGITGLGLRLSAELVRALNGQIGADSQLGKGSRFWFVLPMARAEAFPDVSVEDTLPSGGRVLLVEADASSRERYGDQIESAGWEFECVDDLEEAISVLREAAVAGSSFQACIFSDYAVRPVHAELAIRLKSDDALAPVALVMLTAVGSPGEAKRLWHAGFAAYLRKPVPNEELKETLAALDRRGPDGRGPSLITRHSLAEARSAQPFAPEGIDAVLATLTAPATKSALTIGFAGSDQMEITEALADLGFGIAPANGAEVALARLGTEQYDFIFFDADRLPQADGGLPAAIREKLGAGARVPLIGISGSETVRQRLIEAAVDEAVAKPVRRSDLEVVLRRWVAPPAAEEPAPAPALEPARIDPPAATIEEYVSAAVMAAPAEPEVIESQPVEPTAIESTAVEPAAVQTELEQPAVMEPTPIASAQVEAVVVEAAPVETAVVEAVAVEAAPVEAPVVEAVVVEAAPVEAAVVEPAVVEAAVVEATVIDPPPVEAAAVDAVVETTAVEAAPIVAPEPVIADAEVEATPVAESLVLDAPIEDALVSSDIGLTEVGVDPGPGALARDSASVEALEDLMTLDSTRATGGDPAPLDGLETGMIADESYGPAVVEPVELASVSVPLDSPLENRAIGIEKSAIAEPFAAEQLTEAPIAAEPIVTDSVVTEPIVTDSVVTEPIVTDSVVTEPIASESLLTERDVVEPDVVEPEVVAPEVVAPEVVEPEAVEPEFDAPAFDAPAFDAPEAVESTPAEATANGSAPIETGSPVMDELELDPLIEPEPLATDSLAYHNDVGQSLEPVLELETTTISHADSGAPETLVEEKQVLAPMVAEAPEEALTEPVLSAAAAGQIANGGGFALQHLVITFLRETPARIAETVSGAARGDWTGFGESLDAVHRLATLAGAERLAVLVRRTGQNASDGSAERAVGRLGKIEQAFVEVRELIGSIAPPSLSLDGELAPVNATFLDQLAPERDGAARTLATKLADSFRTDAVARLGDLRQAVEREDCDTGQRFAQTLKGMCGLIGAEPMAKLCALIEADARLKRIGQSRRNLEQLALELDRVLAALAKARGDRTV